MNAPRCSPNDYIAYQIASPSRYTCTEAARCQPEAEQAPAHDAFTRLLQRPPADTADLWQEAQQLIPNQGGDVDKGISWAGIGGGVRIGGPGPRVVGPGAAGATVSGILRAERPHVGESAGVAGRAVRRTEAAGVWRESDGGVRCGSHAEGAGRFRCRRGAAGAGAC